MSKPILPPTFTCEGCYQSFTREPAPAKDTRTKYCSLACKMKVWWQTHQKKIYPPSARIQEQQKLKSEARERRVRERASHISTKTCVQCGRLWPRKSRTCSKACQYARLKTLLRGKKYRPSFKPRFRHALICQDCSRTFSSYRRGSKTCATCTRRALRRADRHIRRARICAVPHERINPLHVFTRDKWKCQLCGVGTPKRLRGLMVDRAPELDHIVPLSRGGSHTWDNVQCTCRKCNGLKGATPRGQQHLRLYGSTR